MEINGNYYNRNSILGYHWHTTTLYRRTYFCIDLVNNKQISILYEDGVGDKYNQDKIEKIIKFIKK